jgi:hypothetical protein
MRALEESLHDWPDDVETPQFFRDRITRMRAELNKKDDDHSPRAQITQEAAVALGTTPEDVSFF